MGSLSNWLELELLDHVCNAAYSPSGTWVLALCTADPTDAGTGASCNEVPNLYGYARTAIDFSAAASRAVDQNGAVTFPQASGGSWGTVSHWAIIDNATYGSGNMLAYGAFSTGKTVNDGDTPSVADSAIDVTYSAGYISNYAANALLDLAFNDTAFTAPDTYIALVDATVGDGDSGSTISEPSGGAYARVQVNPNGGSSPTWTIAASGSLENNNDISFTTATADWGTMVAVAVCDSGTTGAGNLLLYDNAMTDKAVNTDDTAKFTAGDLVITKD